MTKTVAARFATLAVLAILAIAILIGPDGPSPFQPVQSGQNSSSQQSAENEASNVSSAQNLNNRLAMYTLWLAIFTGALVLVSATQIGFLYRSDQSTRIAAEAALKSANTAESTLKDYERPWVFRREVSVKWLGSSGQTVNSWNVSLRWKNVGRMPALLRECVFKIEDIKTLPPDPNYAGAQPLPIIEALAPADDYATMPVGLANPQPTNSQTVIQYVFYGRLTYREMNGIEHMSGFALMIGTHFAGAIDYNSDTYNYYT